MGRRAAWIGMLAAALLLAVVGTARAAFPGDNGRIAFTQIEDVCFPAGCHTSFVHTMDGSGQSPERVALGRGPVWSADGTRLALVDGNAVYTAAPDGSDRRLVLDWGRYVGGLSWSPDGARLAVELEVCESDECRTDIHVVNVDGGGLADITPDLLADRNPAWSPDGESIAYDSVRDGNYDVFLVTPDGSDVTRLTTDAGADSDPSWSPDGTHIAYVSMRSGSGEIFRIRRDGSGALGIATGPSYEPAWSPEGSAIVFSGTREGRHGLFVLNLLTFAEMRVTDDSTTHFDSAPDWQPLPGTPPEGGPRYVRPRFAGPLVTSLVPAYSECAAASATHEHGPPLAFPSCAPVQESAQLTVGTPDSNGAPARSHGFLRLAIQRGDPSTPADEADVIAQLGIVDVRDATLAGYDGELAVRLSARITDRGSDLTPEERGATVVDIPFELPVTCRRTSDPATGGSCGVDTTFDSLVPNVVTERDRAIWELDRVRVFDGGADGVAGTEPNSLFMTQGIFVP
jgi:hypothetical protein